MAAPAIRAEFTVVDIVGAVAVSTAAADRHHLVERASVALFATNIDMCTINQKTCLHVVIERPDIPGDRVVASVAALVEIVVVRVVFTMAGNTVAVFVAECLRRMAVFAFILVVQAEERKACEIVIEKHRVFPINFSVATATSGTQRLFVSIVIQMTGLTTGR